MPQTIVHIVRHIESRTSYPLPPSAAGETKGKYQDSSPYNSAAYTALVGFLDLYSSDCDVGVDYGMDFLF